MKNWKTTVSGIGSAIAWMVTFVAVAPYNLGELGNVIPAPYKEKIAIASLVAGFILKSWNSIAAKDATTPLELDSQIIKK